MQMGAAKQPYTGLMGKVLNSVDRGVRLNAADLYDGFVENGWITKPSETAKREFINQAGNYTAELQNKGIRWLRQSGLQPFATATHTFNVQALRTAALSPGIRDLTLAQRTAFAFDMFGRIVGFVTTKMALNYLLNKDDDTVDNKLMGPTGTGLLDIGWRNADGKTKRFGMGNLFGYGRFGRITGIGPAVEAIRRGRSTGDAVDEAGKSVFNTALGYITGPMSRFLWTAGTGLSPSYPAFQEAPVKQPLDPNDPFSPLKSQVVLNVATALKQANAPIDAGISAAISAYHGDFDLKAWANEAATKQLGRYYPRDVSQVQASEDFTKIVGKSDTARYVKDIMRRAAKMTDENARDKFIDDEMDKIPGDLRLYGDRKRKEFSIRNK